MARQTFVPKSFKAESEVRIEQANTIIADYMRPFQAKQRALWDEIGARGLGDVVSTVTRQHDPRSADYTGPRA